MKTCRGACNRLISCVMGKSRC